MPTLAAVGPEHTVAVVADRPVVVELGPTGGKEWRCLLKWLTEYSTIRF